MTRKDGTFERPKDGAHEMATPRTCPDTRPSASPLRDEDAVLGSLRLELAERFADLPETTVADVIDRRLAAHAAAVNRFYVPALVHGEAVRELLRLRRQSR